MLTAIPRLHSYSAVKINARCGTDHIIRWCNYFATWRIIKRLQRVTISVVTVPGYCNSVGGGGFFDTAVAVPMALVGWQPSELSKRTNSKSKARSCTTGRTHIFKNYMTVSRQSDSKLLDKQSVRMMKLTDGQTRLHYIGTINDDNGCSTTAAGSAAAAVQTVVGGPHTRRRRGRQRGREAPPPEKYVYICHVSAILDVLSTELPVCLTWAKTSKTLQTKSEIRRLRSTYWNANLKRETFRKKTEGLAAMMRADRRFLYAVGGSHWRQCSNWVRERSKQA